jgi:hypothetical protein
LADSSFAKFALVGYLRRGLTHCPKKVLAMGAFVQSWDTVTASPSILRPSPRCPGLRHGSQPDIRYGQRDLASVAAESAQKFFPAAAGRRAAHGAGPATNGSCWPGRYLRQIAATHEIELDREETSALGLQSGAPQLK